VTDLTRVTFHPRPGARPVSAERLCEVFKASGFPHASLYQREADRSIWVAVGDGGLELIESQGVVASANLEFRDDESSTLASHVAGVLDAIDWEADPATWPYQF
jgi:hypothetical protein